MLDKYFFRTYKQEKNNKGLALVMALSLIVIVILLVQETVFDTQVEYRSATANLNRLKAYYSAKAGMEINILRVKTYIQLSQSHGKKPEMQALIPFMNLIWQFPFGWPPSVPKESSSINKQELNALIEKSLMKAQFITSVQPESGRIDINDLASPIPSLRTWTFEVLYRLIENLRAENTKLSESVNEQEVTEVLGNIKDWVDIDQNKADTTSSESDLYELEGLPPNRSFVSKQELLELAGMSLPLYQALSPFITIHGEKGLNINTAPAELIRALHEEFPLELAQEIVALRSQPSKPLFWTKDNFGQFLNEKGFDILNQELQNIQDEDEPINNEEDIETEVKVSYIFFDTPHNFRISSTGLAGESQRTLTAGYFDTSFVTKRFHTLMQEEIKREEKIIQAKMAKARIPTETKKPEGNKKTSEAPPPEAPKEEPTIIYWKESL